MVPHHLVNLHSHLDPHQSDKLDPETDLHQFADDKPQWMEYEFIRELFQRV
jgi:hypothetical protein